MAVPAVFRREILLLALAACAVPSVAVAADDAWQSHVDYLHARAQLNAILLRQDIERASKASPNTPRISSLPTANYPAAPQSPGAGVITARPNGDVEVVRGLRGPGPGSSTIDVQVKEVYPRAKIARRIAESLPIIGGAVTGALLLKDLLDASGIMEGPGGTILMDPGAPQTPQEVWRIFAGDPYCQAATYGASLQCALDDGAAQRGGVAVCDSTAPQQLYPTRWRQSGYPLRPNLDGQGNVTGYFCDYNRGFTVVTNQETALACPPGEVLTFWQDDWCTTPPDDWLTTDVDTGSDRIDTRMGLYPGQTPDLLRELDEKGIGVGAPDLPTVSGPGAIHQGRETTTNQDGTTTVQDTSSDIRYGPQQGTDGLIGPGWEWSDRVETRTYPPGTEPPPPGGDTNPPDTVIVRDGQADSGSGLEDLITCGLPWTPPCKIDETGTPQAPPDTSAQDADGVISGLRDCLIAPGACLPELPELSWAFDLPSGCQPLALPAFSEWLEPIDVCQFQPMIHDLMSMVWAAAGLFAAAGMVFREATGGGS